MAKNISLPGMTVHLIEGPEGTANDMPFIENLYVSGNERRIMENLQKGRFWNVRLIIRRICGLYSANDYICGKMRETSCERQWILQLVFFMKKTERGKKND